MNRAGGLIRAGGSREACDAARSSPGTRCAQPAARRGAGRAQRRAGDARGAGGRQDGAAGVCDRVGSWTCAVARAAGVESEMELAFAALHQLCAPMLDRLERPAGSAARRAGRRVRPERGRRRRTGFWSAWPCSACCRRWLRSSRCCAWSTTRSGWTGPRRRRWRSWRAGCWPSRSRCCSPPVSRARSSRGLPELVVGGLRDADARELLGLGDPGAWMSGCVTASSPRRGATRWRCSSCRAG